ncbi:hypothetical protein CLOBOL_05432 [Enterocloster bolteae ATCC BAA-613]|uniref:Uncharacterized protein n=1 Tax=Enterocloster bolteae (strain ATCC BAA-613 / DSM 15670 / CCUG 46953 / JCM 12243 / WAL 16351) TaxID=411902 RepID=A8RZJ6_ENTBW|nr:hypothetical protein CLOBOL_05432 [Enterocloster bolteae ATCC BAA-613]
MVIPPVHRSFCMIGGKYSGEGSFPILHLVFPPNPHIASCEFACVPDTETLKKQY